MTDSDSEKDEAIRNLRKLGRARKRTLARLDELERAIEDAIVVADQFKVPRLTIAKLSGMVRATVYKVLERKGAHTREAQT